jgi:outer membrane protein assembly factor BamD
VDRDPGQALRAEDECRQLIVQFPNSKYVDETKQILRNIQEALADGEYLVGNFYFKRGDNSAAANRLGHVIEQYPLYSKADQALWDMGQAYGRLGNRFRKQEGEAYSRIVRDYPLSDYADDATRRLKELELPVPEADKGAVARMQYEKEHREKAGLISRSTLFLRRGPDVSTAAHSGDPAMTNMRPSVPPLVPQPAGAGAAGFSGDVTATTVGNSSALDNNPDARANPPSATSTAGQTTDPPQQPASDQNGKKKKKNKKQPQQPAAQAPDTSQPAAAQPAPPASPSSN